MYVVEQTGEHEWYICARTDDGTTIMLTRVGKPYKSRQAAHQRKNRMNERLERLRTRAEQKTSNSQ